MENINSSTHIIISYNKLTHTNKVRISNSKSNNSDEILKLSNIQNYNKKL